MLSTLVTADGVPLSLTLQVELACETMRGRQLGPGMLLLLDLPWECLEHFARNHPFRAALAGEGAQRLTVLQVDGTSARPRSAEALAAARAWVDDLDPETAQEYYSAAEPAEAEDEDEAAEFIPEPAAPASRRPVTPVEAAMPSTRPAPSRQAHGLFNPSPGRCSVQDRPSGTGSTARPCAWASTGERVRGAPAGRCCGPAGRAASDGDFHRDAASGFAVLLEKLAGGSRSQDTIQDALGGAGSASDYVGLRQPEGAFCRASHAGPCCGHSGRRLGDRSPHRQRGSERLLQPAACVYGAGRSGQRKAVSGVASSWISRSCSSDVAGQAGSGAKALQPTLCATVAGGEPRLPEGPGLCRDAPGPDRVKGAGPGPTAHNGGEGSCPSRRSRVARGARTAKRAAKRLRELRVGVLETSPPKPPATGLPNFDPQSTERVDPHKLASRMLSAFYNSGSSLVWFTKLSLSNPACTVEVGDVSPDLWPVPPPRWCWTACARGGGRSRRRKRRLELQARLLQVVVCALNWECLGYPKDPPRHARVGSPTTVAQQKVLDHLEAQIGHFLDVSSFETDDLGRSASKFDSLARTTL